MESMDNADPVTSRPIKFSDGSGIYFPQPHDGFQNPRARYPTRTEASGSTDFQSSPDTTQSAPGRLPSQGSFQQVDIVQSSPRPDLKIASCPLSGADLTSSPLEADLDINKDNFENIGIDFQAFFNGPISESTSLEEQSTLTVPHAYRNRIVNNFTATSTYHQHNTLDTYGTTFANGAYQQPDRNIYSNPFNFMMDTRLPFSRVPDRDRGHQNQNQNQNQTQAYGQTMNMSTNAARDVTDERAMMVLRAQLSRLDQGQDPHETQMAQYGGDRVQSLGVHDYRSPVYPAHLQNMSFQQQQQGGTMMTTTTPGRSHLANPAQSYRKDARSSNNNEENVESFHGRTPAGPGAGGHHPVRTEPRSFAPRTQGSATGIQPPPRFDLQQAPMRGLITQHMNNQGFSPPQNAGNQDFNQRGFPHYGHQQGQGHGKSIQYPGGHCGNLSSNRGVNHRAFGSFDGLSGNPQPIEAPTRAGPSSALVTHTSSTPNYVRSQRSDQLNDLTSGPDQRPAATIALRADNFPFVEGARYDYSPSTYGVVKIKNIPFDTNRAEIIAMLGRNSKIINDRHEPVHIIMERVTNRTGDAYVEFMTMYDAAQTVEKHQRASAQGRPHRLGDRPVEMELSSQAALMRDLFPNARGILWDGATPHIQPLNPTEPWLSFKGFITEEEMTMLVKHVEVPQRSPFSRDCPQRPFECMISTMRKFPWYMTDCITIKQRQSVYAACVNLLRLLQEAMEKKKHEHVLNSQLYRRLWTSAMICRGFTVTMKDSISYLVGLTDEDKREFNMPRFADQWVHIYTLVPKPGTPLDVIEWYIAIIREETNRTVAQSLPNVQSELQRQGRQTSLYWGYLWKEVSHPYGPGFDNMTLAEMAHREFSALSNILRRALD